MLKKYYTTGMSSSGKKLKNRFLKMQANPCRTAGIMTALAVIMLTACAGAVVARIDNKPKNFFVNGKGYEIMPVLIDNSMATHTDNYYVPLRDTFEALGYEVYYDVDKMKYREKIREKIFPFYENEAVKTGYDEATGESYVMDDTVYYNWLKSLVTNDVDMYIYGSTGFLNGQMPIIEMVKNETTEYCQIGSSYYSSGYALAPVLIEDKTYIPLRAVAGIVGGMNNVKWDETRHDTYFEGVLTFDEQEMKVEIILPEEG